MKYSVYVLIKNGLPVYVGCSTNMVNRLRFHKINKDFDSHVIIESFKDKRHALAAERSIINFYSLFRKHDWYNGEKWIMSYERQFNPKFHTV